MAVEGSALRSGDASRTVRVGFLAPGPVAAAALLATVALGTTLPPPLRYAPLAASVVLFGLPHGAVDHLAVARARGADTPTAVASAGAVGALYLVLGAAYGAVWFVAPGVAAVGFVLLTWLHWGQGDLHASLVLADADHLRTRTQRALFVAVRGGLPMLVPLLGFPATYRRVLSSFAALFGDGSLGRAAVLFSPGARLVLGTAFAALTVASLALGLARTADPRSWAVDAAETVLLWACFLAVPPLVAVGTYFCLWHALRHVARLLLLDDRAAGSLRAGRPVAALRRFARDAAPLSALSLVLLAGFALVVPAAPSSALDLTALYLVFISMLTLPHVVVVALLDRAEGVWRPGDSTE
ncbi:beta-carotene 15,15'-monooxygenase [Halobacteriales archaeon QS_9_68_17]|nr:MAG: beta-carotene 15,15'-monooxygenase [Halobacteriales archaeon QS_9_68_17]